MNDGRSCRRGRPWLWRPTAATVAVAVIALLKYAECMRSHGITDFPDPVENSHQIGFDTQGDGHRPELTAGQGRQ